MSVSEYLRKNLFDFLDITDFYWEKCPNGIEKGGWGLYIRKEDLAKLGLLIMQNGIWNGKKLINSKYVSDMTHIQIETPLEYGDYNYGFHTWCGRTSNSFLFNGMLGQNMLCFRHSGIIVVANCANCDLFQQNAFFKICDEYLGGVFGDILPIDQDEQYKLCQLKDRLKQSKPIESFLPTRQNRRNPHDDINAIDGKRFSVVSENKVSAGVAPIVMQYIQCQYTEGLTEIGFYKTQNGLDVHFVEENQLHVITIGFDQSKTSNLKFGADYFTVSCIGEFCENEEGIPILKLELDFLETPFSRIIKFYFQKDKCSAVFNEFPVYDLIKNPVIFDNFINSTGSVIKSMASKVDLEFITLKAGRIFAPQLILEEITT